MATVFKSGSSAITNGASEVSITGLSLGFDPAVVRVSVRQPSTDTDIINAYVAGTPTRTGFSVILSAPVPQDGYYLDWTAFNEGSSTPIAGDTLSVSYTDLKNEVAKFLGYNPSSLSPAQVSEVDGYIQSGVRNFYYPPKMDGVDEGYEWSFLRQSGSVTTTNGVSEYSLPDGFGRIAGQLVFSDSEARKSVPVIPYGDIKRMLAEHSYIRERPRVAATMSASSFGERGQLKKLYLFPVPDRQYELTFVCDADTGKIDATTRPFPLGGAMYSELVIESCLAVAEQRANDEIGYHTVKFRELLISTISRDRRSGAQVFGRVGDPDAFQW